MIAGTSVGGVVVAVGGVVDRRGLDRRRVLGVPGADRLVGTPLRPGVDRRHGHRGVRGVLDLRRRQRACRPRSRPGRPGPAARRSGSAPDGVTSSTSTPVRGPVHNGAVPPRGSRPGVRVGVLLGVLRRRPGSTRPRGPSPSRTRIWTSVSVTAGSCAQVTPTREKPFVLGGGDRQHRLVGGHAGHRLGGAVLDVGGRARGPPPSPWRPRRSTSSTGSGWGPASA